MSGRGPNPFTNRAMILQPGDFFGRGREIEQLLSRLAGSSKAQSCAVVGQRRIGKSSLFRRLVELVPARVPRAVVAYYDLEASRKLTAGRFYRALLRLLTRAAGLAGHPGGETAAGPGGDPDAFDDLVAFLEREEGERRFVLLLDEFDTVTANPNFDADFFGSLRSLTNNHDLAFVTSSYEDLTELCHAEEVRQSPFFNVFTTIDLRLMPPGEIEQMLSSLSRRGGRALTPAELALVGELGGCFPFFCQIAASALWEDGEDGEDGGDGAARFERVRARFREEAWPHFRYFVDHLSADARQALVRLPAGETPPSPLARRLARRSLLVETPGGPPRAFAGPFLDYLAERARLEAMAAATSGAGAGGNSILAAATVTAAELRAGAVVADRYHLLDPLGSGAFGCVYAARDAVLERTVALKVLRLEPSRSPADAAGREKRFRREAQALARMKHPNVVTVFDLGSWQGQWFIAMELVAGGTLADLLERRGRLAPGEAAAVVRQAALGLAHAHQAGVIHRDVKPANLLLEPDGRVRVGDFGILRYQDGGSDRGEALTWDGRALGTPAYMAPEQLRAGARVDERADVYALGVVLYEALAGRRPFVADDLSGILWQVVFGQAADLAGQAPGVPEALVTVVRRAMAREPEGRYLRAEDLAEALAPFATALRLAGEA